MKQGEILNAYRVLGESKMSTLEVGEVVKVVKARKAMRPIAEGLDAFMKDIQEKAARRYTFPYIPNLIADDSV